jgi:hypothetical protein
VEFKKPDHILRLQIWENLRPPKLRLAEDVDLMELAMKYELTGGFLKNTWLTVRAPLPQPHSCLYCGTHVLCM